MFSTRFIVVLSAFSFLIISFTAPDFAHQITAFILFIIFSVYLVLDYIYDYYSKRKSWVY